MKTEKIDKILEYILYILIFITPISRSGVSIFTFILLVVWLVKKINHRTLLNKEYINIKKWLLIYGIVNLLTLFNAINLYGGVANFIDEYLKYTITFIIVLDILKSEKQFKKVFMILPFSAVLVFAYGIYQHDILDIKRIAISFSNPNPAGTYAMITTLLNISFLIWFKQRWVKIVTAFLAIFGSIILIYTGSRGAILGYVTGFIIIIIISIKKYEFKKYWKLLLILFVMMVLLINLVPSNVLYRFKKISDLKTVEQRLFMYKTGLKLISDHPLLGIGRGQFRYTYPYYKPEQARNFTHIHSLYIHLPVEIGIPGFIIFLLLLKKIFYDNIKKWKGNNPWLHYGVIIGVVGAGVHNFFDWTFLNSQVGIYLIILTAMWLNNINYEVLEELEENND